MREEISRILVKWSMPTRQAAILEIVRFIEKLYGDCDLCYGKGYSTQGVALKDGADVLEDAKISILFCKCNRGKQLEELLKNNPIYY